MEYLIGEKNVESEEKSLKLSYYLLENEGENRKIYGIKISACDGGNSASDSVKSVSYSKDIVKEIAGVLMKNSVTPFGITDAMDELYCSGWSGE